MKILRTSWVTATILALLLSACSSLGPRPPVSESTQAVGPAQQTENSSCVQAALIPSPTSATINPAYPTPLSANPSYPAPTQVGNGLPNSSYPAPPASPTPRVGTKVMVVPFRINKPVLAGATKVTGTGPAGIPVTLANIFLMGEILGETTIQPDCTYTIQLQQPLEKNTWIGITYSNLKGTKWVPEDFLNPGFRSDGAQQVPQVGYFYDTATAVDGK